MIWEELLADNVVSAVPTSKQESDNLRSIVTRSLKEVTATGFSADARFVMAYDAARALSLTIVRATGHRPRTGGAYLNTFRALGVADPAFTKLSVYSDSCRRKRNAFEYDFADGVTDTDAKELLKVVREFVTDAEDRIKQKYPTFL